MTETPEEIQHVEYEEMRREPLDDGWAVSEEDAKYA